MFKAMYTQMNMSTDDAYCCAPSSFCAYNMNVNFWDTAKIAVSLFIIALTGLLQVRITKPAAVYVAAGRAEA